MKKIFLICLIVFSFNSCFALNEDVIELELDETEKNIHPVVVEKEISPYSKEALRGIIEKEYDLNSSKGLFSEQLKLNFKSGIVENAKFHGHIIHTFNENIDDNDSDLKFNTNLINVGVAGDFKSKKESYNFLFDLTPGVYEDFSHRFLLDAYIQTNRIKNNKLMFGTSRPNVGYEGGMSAKTTPFILRSQSARHLGNARKTGVRLIGDYKYLNYDLGGYSSDTRFHEFMPGVETNLWVEAKPLANLEAKKYGKLFVGGGINTGERNSQDFLVASSALRYERDKFWLRAEYQNSDGSNGGDGITDKKRMGYNLTLAYRLTKKLEFLLRYDDFDPNKKVSGNNSREYSAGLNWYLLGQGARLIFNYVFCENKSASDSHKLIFGTQFIL